MIKVVIIIGPSGSGKSYLQKLIVEKGFSEVISATTRDIRLGELDGLHYYFKKNNEDFFKDEYIEFNKIADKYYGTPIKEFYKSNKIVHVVEPYGAKQIYDKFKNDTNFDIKIIFMDISRDICLKNLLKGESFLSEKDKLRLDRDLKDDIKKRLEETKMIPDIVVSDLNYDIDFIMDIIEKK